MDKKDLKRPKINEFFPGDFGVDKINNVFLQNKELYRYIQALDSYADGCEDAIAQMADTRPRDSQYANSESQLSDENKEKNYNADFLWPYEEGSIEALGYEFANAKTIEYQIEIWKALKEYIITPSTSLVEALEKAVSLIKTQYFINFPDTDESDFESFRKIDPHMIVIDKALTAHRSEEKKSTQCSKCGKPHNLIDEDAGSEREIQGLCTSCYNLAQFDTPQESEKECECNSTAIPCPEESCDKCSVCGKKIGH